VYKAKILFAEGGLPPWHLEATFCIQGTPSSFPYLLLGRAELESGDTGTRRGGKVGIAATARSGSSAPTSGASAPRVDREARATAATRGRVATPPSPGPDDDATALRVEIVIASLPAGTSTPPRRSSRA
jgi:hypothetical protein